MLKLSFLNLIKNLNLKNKSIQSPSTPLFDRLVPFPLLAEEKYRAEREWERKREMKFSEWEKILAIGLFLSVFFSYSFIAFFIKIGNCLSTTLRNQSLLSQHALVDILLSFYKSSLNRSFYKAPSMVIQSDNQ